MIWKLTYASWALWSFAVTFYCQFASLLALLPSTFLFRSNCTSLLHPYAHVLLAPSCLVLLVPASLQWWLCFDVTENAACAQLLQRTKRLPAWETILWCKTPLRTLKVALYLSAAALAGKPFVAAILAHPAWRCGAERAEVSALLLAPFGLFAALCAMHMRLDTPAYPAIQQRRVTRLRDRGAPIVAAAALTWLAASACSVLLYVLTPARVPRAFIDCVASGVASLCYVVALLAAAHLSGVVLAERAGTAYISSMPVSEVRLPVQHCIGPAQPHCHSSQRLFAITPHSRDRHERRDDVTTPWMGFSRRPRLTGVCRGSKLASTLQRCLDRPTERRALCRG